MSEPEPPPPHAPDPPPRKPLRKLPLAEPNPFELDEEVPPERYPPLVDYDD